MEKKLNKIKVISPFRNISSFIDNAVTSILTQDYENFEFLAIDDASTDDSYSKLPAITYRVDELGNPLKDNEGNIIIEDTPPILQVTKCKNFVAWRSSERNTALPNIYNAVVNFCTDPEDIIVLVDLDDALIGRNALSYVNDIYNKGIGGINKIVENEDLKNYPENIRKTNEVLMSYGSCRWSNGNTCFSKPYSEDEFKNIKLAPFKVSHLRTFRAKVFLDIIKQDPELKCFKDDKGNFYTSGYDTAILIPLLQICSYEHTYYNDKPLYYYNLHQNNDHVINQDLQWRVHSEALKKAPFKKIEI